MKKLLVMLGLSLMAQLYAQSSNSQIISGFASPESVFVNRDFIFVANIGKEAAPLAKDKDGFISKLDKNGKLIEREFITGLNAPKGMAESAGVLYVVDIDTLYGFNINTKRQVFALTLKEAGLLNDIAKLDDNTLFVSDTASGAIYRVSLKSKSYKEFYKLDINKVGGANGLLLSVDKKQLFIAGYHPNGTSGGKVLSLDLATKRLNVVLDKKGAYDGIAFSKDGSLLVSDWGENLRGVIHKITNGKDSLIDLAPLRGPADMFSDETKLYIPQMLENQVLVINLP